MHSHVRAQLHPAFVARSYFSETKLSLLEYREVIFSYTRNDFVPLIIRAQ